MAHAWHPWCTLVPMHVHAPAPVHDSAQLGEQCNAQTPLTQVVLLCDTARRLLIWRLDWELNKYIFRTTSPKPWVPRSLSCGVVEGNPFAPPPQPSLAPTSDPTLQGDPR